MCKSLKAPWSRESLATTDRYRLFKLRKQKTSCKRLRPSAKTNRRKKGRRVHCTGFEFVINFRTRPKKCMRHKFERHFCCACYCCCCFSNDRASSLCATFELFTRRLRLLLKALESNALRRYFYIKTRRC